jgi:hypothetical protein
VSQPPNGWSGRDTALAEEHWPELLHLIDLREQIPSLDELAERWGVPKRTVQRYLYGKLPKRIHAARRDR